MLLFIIGLASGIISAMGIGGGTILIPALIFATGTSQHVAQSVNLISFIPVAVVALAIHFKNKNLHTDHAFLLILAGLAGALIGAGLAVRLSGEVLSKLFGIFLFLMGCYEIIYKKKE